MGFLKIKNANRWVSYIFYGGQYIYLDCALSKKYRITNFTILFMITRYASLKWLSIAISARLIFSLALGQIYITVMRPLV
jgi:hypothetical protein